MINLQMTVCLRRFRFIPQEKQLLLCVHFSQLCLQCIRIRILQHQQDIHHNTILRHFTINIIAVRRSAVRKIQFSFHLIFKFAKINQKHILPNHVQEIMILLLLHEGADSVHPFLRQSACCTVSLILHIIQHRPIHRDNRQAQIKPL